MATYEYKCPKCGHELSLTMSMAQYSGAFNGNSANGPSCPECHFLPMRRVFSPPGVNIK